MKKGLKRILALSLSLILVLSLCACGSSDSGSSSSGGSDSAASSDSGSSSSKSARRFDLSTTASANSLLGETTQYFADQVEELSDGEMAVDIFWSSAIGTEAQNLEALTSGTLDMAVIAVEFYANSIPELGALILPYLYSDYDQVQTVLTGEAGDYASERLLDVAKVVNLGYYVMMFRELYTKGKPIYTPEDLKGMKIRVPESTLYVNTFTMLGAAPTPMAMGEVYTSLDTGVIDGYENTPDSCIDNSFYEVLDYMNLTRHLNAPTTFSMSQMVYDTLTPEQQDILKQAGAAASVYGLELTKEFDQELIDELSDKLEIIDPDIDAMKAAIDYNNYDFMESDEAQHLLELVQEVVG